MNLKPYLWTAPFLSFLLGYTLLHCMLSINTLETPQLIGKSISDALKILNTKNLNIRVVHEKEDKDLDEGIILSQTPQENQKIKPYQHIFVVVSKKPPKIELPSIVGLSLEAAQKKTNSLNIINRIYKLPTHYPHNTVIAQLPSAHELIEDNKMMSYVSYNQEQLVIFPDLKARTLDEVNDFLRLYGITPKVYHRKPVDQKHSCKLCKVVQQKPLPGSIVHLDNTLSVYIEV